MPLFFQLVGSFLWSAITSRVGQIAISFFVAWMWSGLKTDSYWKSVIASQDAAREAAYQKELSRQEQAARDIAADATARAEDDIKAQEEMRRIIEAFDKRNPIYVTKKVIVPGKAGDCRIDGDFNSFVRQLDAQARAGKAPRRSR